MSRRPISRTRVSYQVATLQFVAVIGRDDGVSLFCTPDVTPY